MAKENSEPVRAADGSEIPLALALEFIVECSPLDRHLPVGTRLPKDHPKRSVGRI